jgi:hypothetical protein
VLSTDTGLTMYHGASTGWGLGQKWRIAEGPRRLDRLRPRLPPDRKLAAVSYTPGYTRHYTATRNVLPCLQLAACAHTCSI